MEVLARGLGICNPCSLLFVIYFFTKFGIKFTKSRIGISYTSDNDEK